MPKKSALLLFCGFLLLAVAGSLPASHTALDGASWRRISSLNVDEQVRVSVKLSYLKGILNSPRSSSLYALNEPSRYAGASSRNLRAMSGGDLVRAVDRFYSDNRNISIPLADALTVIDFQASGIGQPIIDEKLTSLQRRYAD